MLRGSSAISRRSARGLPSVRRTSAAHVNVTKTRSQDRSAVRAGAGAAGVERMRSGGSLLVSEFTRDVRDGTELVALGSAYP